MAKSNVYIPDDCKDLCKALLSVSDRYSTWQVFEDWLMMFAISISNAVDLEFKDEREEKYMEIVKKYNKKELEQIVKCCATFTDSLQGAFDTQGITDIMGKVFHALELHNKYHGQFFTPYDICKAMGEMTVGEELFEDKDFLFVNEPCIGSGGMVLGVADAMMTLKHNPQQELCIIGTDIDIKCVCMSYLQLSLYGIPAVIVHGNSLTLEQWSVWKTPAYILGFWDYKTKHRQEINQPAEEKETAAAIETPKSNKEPPKFDIDFSTNRNGQLSLF